MRISTKGRYGVRILLDLALHDSATPRQIRDIALSQQLSEKYISRLIIDLRRANIICSIRGVKGGYRIAQDPNSVTLLKIIEVMEGPLSIVNCLRSTKKCRRSRACPSHDIWHKLNQEIRDNMGKITLQDIIDNYRQKHIDGWMPDCCI
jgi:Rrf2 family cysteine metabolism transcriptional repressor